MGQFIEAFGTSISYIFWMLICFVEVAFPLFVVALILHLWRMHKKQNDWKDILCTKDKIVNNIVLILFPPMAAYEFGVGKALMTLLMQFIGFIATFSLLILMQKTIDINIDYLWGIVALFVLSWGTGILCAIIQKKNLQSYNNQQLRQI